MRRLFSILLKLFLLGLFLLVLGVFSSVWWFPWLVPGLLGWAGGSVDELERVDGGRLRLVAVEFEVENARLRADWVELPQPLYYLWERARGDFSANASLSAGKVDVLLTGEKKPQAEDDTLEDFDLAGVLEQVDEGLELARNWFPGASLESLLLRQAGNTLLELNSMRLDRDFSGGGSVKTFYWPEPLELEVNLSSSEAWRLRLTSPDLVLSLDAKLEAQDGEYVLNGTLLSGSERILGRARFVHGAALPDFVELSSSGFELDRALPYVAEVLDRLEIEDLRLRQMQLVWNGRAYEGLLDLEGQRGVFVQESLLPVELKVELKGDFHSVKLRRLNLSLPFASLHLDKPASIDFKTLRVEPSASMEARIDLGAQNFVEGLAGTVVAEISVSSSPQDPLDLEFRILAEDLAYESFHIDELRAAGSFDGRVLEVAELRGTLESLEGADFFEVSGRYDVQSRKVDFDYALEIGEQWLNQVVEMDLFRDRAVLNGRVYGPASELQTEGDIGELTLYYSGLEPVQVSGTFASRGLEQVAFEGVFKNPLASIETAVAVNRNEKTIDLEIEHLHFVDEAGEALKLSEPTRIIYHVDRSEQAIKEQFTLAPFSATSGDSSINASYSREDGLKLEVAEFSSAQVRAWIPGNLPLVYVEHLSLNLLSMESGIGGRVEAKLSIDLEDEQAFQTQIRAELTNHGVLVETLNFSLSGEPLLLGNAMLPLRLKMPVDDGSFYEILEDQPLSAVFNGETRAAVTRNLEQFSGVRLDEGSVNISLDGTVKQPRGNVNISVGNISTGREKWPNLRNLNLDAEVSRDTLTINNLSLLLNDSEAVVSGIIPIADLSNFMRPDEPEIEDFLTVISGQISLNDWRVENWLEWMPPAMRQSGELSGQLVLKPDLQFSGQLSFKDFALRPTTTLSTIDSIEGRIQLSDKRVEIVETRASVGGNTVNLQGWLLFENWEEPTWEFELTGQNIPLIRTTDMILRSDLDLKASHKTAEGSPLVSGDLNLRSSTLLMEFDPFSPNVSSGPQQRPPFFSIDEPTLADWRFDLRIFGDGFMRVRSPYFRTRLSADFNLGGTFEAPLLIGSLRMLEGRLIFPGASMQIDRGEVFIEPNRPDELQIDLAGVAQTPSYVITMEVRETVNAPQIYFQSSPELSNAAIFRLLATGSLSGGGAGAVGLYLGRGLLGAGGMNETMMDRLKVDVGETKSRSGRNTIGVRFDLLKEVYLEGGYDVFDAYNLNLIWRVFSR